MRTSKRLRRLLSVVLCAVLLLSSVGLSASAAGETPSGYIEMLPSSQDVSAEDYAAFMRQYGDAVSAVYAGIAAKESSISVKDYQIPTSKAGILLDTMRVTFPELCYVSYFQYSYYNNGTIYAIAPVYSGGTEMKDRFIEAAEERYLSLVTDDMDDFTKALILHDALMINTYYPNLKQNPDRGSNYTYMVENWGVCQYYAESYAYLLAQNGIRSEIINSGDMNHAWLKVKLDGSYYHVDSTWDDVYPDRGGKARHKYFLYSDAAFPSDHYGYRSIHPADSTRFDGYTNLHGIETQLCYLDGTFYGITKNGRLVAYDPSDDSVETLKTLDYRWYAEGNSYWVGNFSSLAAYRGKLYYNSPDAVYEYDPATGEEVKFISGESGRVLYGLRILNNQLFGYYANNPSGDESALPPTPEYLAELAVPHPVTIADGIANGTVEANISSAYEGEPVTLTVSPDAGYKLTSLAYNGVEIEPEDGTYRFIMPDQDVTITATFDKAYFTGHSLSLKGDIGVNFYVDLTADEAANATVDFSWIAEGVTKTASADLSQAEHKDIGYKAICDVAPAEMTCEVTATLTIGGETEEVNTYSAARYAGVILNDPDFAADYILAENNRGKNGTERLEQLQRLVASMLHLGAAAQQAFTVNLNDLADADLDEQYATAPVSPDDIRVAAADMTANLDKYGLAYNGSSLICEANTSLRHYYRIVNQSLFDAVRGGVTFNGSPVDYHTKDGEIYFELKDISAADLDTEMTLTIGDDAYAYSALHYVKRALQPDQTDEAVRQLATTIYWYNQYANAFIGR